MYKILLKLSNYFIVIEILVSAIRLSSFEIDENGVLLSTANNKETVIEIKGTILKGKSSLESSLTFEKAFLANVSNKNDLLKQEWALFDIEVLDIKVIGDEVILKIKYSDKIKLL